MAARKAPVELRSMTEEAITRRLFAELADDVLLLRARGHSVARFREDFRVDREVLRYDQVQAKAAELRKVKTDSRATRVVDGSEVVVESHKRTKKPRAKEPETVVGLAGEADAPAHHCPQCSALAQRVEFLFAIVAEAITGRRESLGEQVVGLEKLEAILRQSA